MSNNQHSHPSRWATKPEPRNRSQSWNERAPSSQHRGYETTGGPPPFSRDHDRDRNRHEDRREYDRRGRRDSRGEFNDWRCMECGLFNDPRDERCPRCGEWKPRERGRDRDDGDYYGPPRSREDDDDEHDGRRRKKSRGEPKKPEWPPAFEEGGASYIFDARSGMFYEPRSDFFYDPKTKLYYSNKKQKYFHFMKGMDPEFQAVDNQQQGAGGVTSGGTGLASSQSVPTGNDTANADGVSKIAISLKTTALPSAPAVAGAPTSSAATERYKLIEKLRKASNVPVPSASAEVVPQVHKKHAKDMDVWSNRIKEMKGEDAPDAASQQATTSSEPTEVKTTTSGQPICTLCRRKFANVEKLRQHEQLSALHQENLAKKAAADAQAAKQKETTTTETIYRDRTKERQMLYSASSTDASHVDKLLASVNPVASVEKQSEVVRPEQTLGDTNVGNQLLQKMGWKSGEALGRKQEGETGTETVANSLKNDWERIESLAQSGGRGRR